MQQFRLESIEMTDLGQSVEWINEMKKSVAAESVSGAGTRGRGDGGVGRIAGSGAGGAGRGQGGAGGAGGASFDTTGELGSRQPSGGGSAYMASVRSRHAEELKDPKVRADVIGIISREQSGVEGRSRVFEAMSNRARLRGHTLEQEMHSGFYGPVGGPHHHGAIPQPTNRQDINIGNQVISRVLGGQNLLGSRTDQGSKKDPNYSKYAANPGRWSPVYHQGEQYADVNPEWGKRDRAAQAAYDATHPGGSGGGSRGRGREDNTASAPQRQRTPPPHHAFPRPNRFPRASPNIRPERAPNLGMLRHTPLPHHAFPRPGRFPKAARTPHRFESYPHPGIPGSSKE